MKFNNYILKPKKKDLKLHELMLIAVSYKPRKIRITLLQYSNIMIDYIPKHRYHLFDSIGGIPVEII